MNDSSLSGLVTFQVLTPYLVLVATGSDNTDLVCGKQRRGARSPWISFQELGEPWESTTMPSSCFPLMLPNCCLVWLRAGEPHYRQRTSLCGAAGNTDKPVGRQESRRQAGLSLLDSRLPFPTATSSQEETSILLFNEAPKNPT